MVTEDLFQSCRNRTVERASIPAKACPAFPATPVRKENKVELTTHGLSLLTPGIKNRREESDSCGSRAISSSAGNAQSNSRTGPHQQTARKQRRCWSPELHKRFVNALQQLGGSQGKILDIIFLQMTSLFAKNLQLK